MARVFLPSGLTNRDTPDPLIVDAPRVLELMELLARRFPELSDVLPSMAVAIDGEIYNDADYRPLSDDSEVHLVPRVAGGNQLATSNW